MSTSDKMDEKDEKTAREWREEKKLYENALIALTVAHSNCLDYAASLIARNRQIDVRFASDSRFGTIEISVGKPYFLQNVTVSWNKAANAIDVRTTRDCVALPSFALKAHPQDIRADALSIVKVVVAEIEQLIL